MDAEAGRTEMYSPHAPYSRSSINPPIKLFF